MKNLYQQLGIYASMIIMLSSCDQFETQEFHVDKPESIIAQEERDAYNDLKSYINRTANPSFHFGASISLDNYNSKGILHRMLNENFDEVEASTMNHGAIVQANGSLALGNWMNLMSTAQAAQTSVFGPALISHAGQNAAYLNSLIAPLVITGDAARVVVADFDNDNLGKTYPMTVSGGTNSSTVVVNNINNTGRVLNVKSVRSHPQFNVTLPQGRVLGDYVSLTLDMYITDATGGYGSGMRIFVNGRSGSYGSALSYVPNRAWGKMTLPLATMNLTATEKQLNSFTLAVGSETGAGDYFIDNIAFQDINVTKTPEQKRQIIETELQRWITTVVDTSKSYVKAWDVVDRPMDNLNPSQLRTGAGKPTLPADQFFWQDYLSRDYGVKAFQLARQHGNQGDKFFIAEDSLSFNPAKLNGLLGYIGYIEGQGAVVDGISTILNLTISSDKNEIVTMFQSLAATGKLVRVSKLRVEIPTSTAATNESYQQQSDMYKYVIQKYFELVPVAQRYGISINGLVEGVDVVSPSRAGIWINNAQKSYFRKPAYVGVLEGLSGK